jgi:hypothetical protein
MGCDLWFSSTLAEDVKIVVSRYWQAMHWCKEQQRKGAGIGKQCAGRRSDNRREWVLVAMRW